MSRHILCSCFGLFSAAVGKVALLIACSLPVLAQFADPVATAGVVGPVDEQTGYFPQPLRVTNPGTTDYQAIRVLIRDLPVDVRTNIVRVANAHGLTNKIPFFDFGPIPAGASVDFRVEYYVMNRRPFPAPRYEVMVITPRPVFLASSLIVNTNATLFDVSSGRYFAQFKTEEGRNYFVQYNSNLSATNGWKTSLPGLRGTGNVVLWEDSGPPRTESLPTTAGSRFYRVIVLREP